ncbi:GNAT family N-acetyltransferase [Kocuria marina]|uniref:GNAT family N-acetyltransferase n=1 Tax=Kocuria marina TaxID=223184 RepID=UPI0022DF7006|nr:GNAT family N-acetyltransferase [Kocuria marina]
MDVTYSVPAPELLTAVVEQLARWQVDPWAGHLHPGDLGWHSSVGPEQMARDLRVWELDGEAVALGMLDGPEVLRIAVSPELNQDQALAQRIADNLNENAVDFFTGQEAIVEARGASALRQALRSSGWIDDDAWTPMTLALSTPLDLARLEAAPLNIVEVGPEAAADWTSVHWSSFKGTPFTKDARSWFVDRWTHIMTGPFAARAQSLMAYDGSGQPVAVTTVWTAGEGRPGLVEPMGVHRDHHGRGYATAITLAGARTLQRRGASSAAVVAENSNLAALATYRSAGFLTQEQVTDLKRA